MVVEHRIATQNERDIVGRRIDALRNMMHRYAQAGPEADAFIRSTAITEGISLLARDEKKAESMMRSVSEGFTTTEAYVDHFTHTLSRMNQVNEAERSIASGVVSTVTTMLESVFEVRKEQRLNMIDVVPRGVDEVIIFHGREGRANGHTSVNDQPKPAGRLIDVA